jgi:hypothetical protein
MPLIRFLTTAPARRARSAGPSCRGGASSVLRIGQPTTPLVPMARVLAQRLGASVRNPTEGA